MKSGLKLVLATAVLMTSHMGFGDTKYEEYKKQHSKRVGQIHQDNINIAKKVDRIATPLREKLMTAAKQKNPRAFSNMQKEISQMQRDRLSGKEKMEAMIKINERYERLFKSVLPEVQREARQYRMAMKNFSRTLGAQFIESEFFGGFLEWLFRRQEEPTPGTVDQEFLITGNYEFDIVNTSGHLVAAVWGSGNTSTGRSEANGLSLYAGGFSAEGGVAKLVEVPAGYDKMRVSLLAEVDAYGHALSLGGIASFSSSTLLEITGEDFDNVVCSNNKPGVFAIAPILWHHIATVEEPQQLSCEIDLTGDSQSVMVSVSSLVSGMAAVLAGGSVRASQTPYELKVQLLTQD